MNIRKSLKVVIVFLLSCILISVNCMNSIAYYELPYHHYVDDFGTDSYSNVKIDGIYYNITRYSKKDCTVYAFYPFTSEDTLKIPNKIKFKGKKHVVNNVLFDSNEEQCVNGECKLPSKFVLPYKTIHLPKYANFFYISPDIKLPNLKKIYIPKKIDNLSCLSDMPKLKVIIDKKNPYIKMKNGAVYSKDGKKLLSLINSKKKYKIVKNTEHVNFNNSNSNNTVEKVILSPSVKEISSAFSYCLKLKSVKLNKQLTVIGDSAFLKCKSLKSITIPENFEEIQFWAFKNCRKLSKVKIKSEEKVPIIEDNAFKNTKDGIKFYVKNQTVADQLNEQLKGSGVKKAKILVGKKVVYKNVK